MEGRGAELRPPPQPFFHGDGVGGSPRLTSRCCILTFHGEPRLHYHRTGLPSSATFQVVIPPPLPSSVPQCLGAQLKRPWAEHGQNIFIIRSHMHNRKPNQIACSGPHALVLNTTYFECTSVQSAFTHRCMRKWSLLLHTPLSEEQWTLQRQQLEQTPQLSKEAPEDNNKPVTVNAQMSKAATVHILNTAVRSLLSVMFVGSVRIW